MTQTGMVISEDGDNIVVRVMRKSACDGCKQKNLCGGAPGGCSEQKPLDVTLKNTAGASVGDTVELCSDSSFILGVAFCIFVLPILSAFAAYFLCAAFTEKTTLHYAACAAAFLISAGAFLCFFNNRIKKKSYVEIVKILKEDNNPDQ